MAGVQVDLVARRGDVHAVVEVKWRGRGAPGAEHGQGAFVTAGQVRRLRRAAGEWSERSHGQEGVTRVDVIVLRPFGPWPPCIHLEDVR